MPRKLLRYADLVERGLVRNRMTLRRWILAGRFPAPIALGPNTLAWPEDEIEAFENKCERVIPSSQPEPEAA